MLLDLFAGPGGWDEGARMIGRTDVVGLEWDQAACLTAVAAGHARIRTDVARYPTAPFLGKVDALIASPPCQAWSMAGKRKGELDRANCHVLADRMAQGDDSLDWTEWEDPRSALVCQPVRWVRDLRPPLIALEEVPQVQGLWEHFARIFRAWGYSTWVKVLCAADYGVPQERFRVILGASLNGQCSPPEPTHSEEQHGNDLFGAARLPWVSMAEALTELRWTDEVRLRHPRGAGMVERYGAREDRLGREVAMTVTGKVRSWTVTQGSKSRPISIPEASILQGFPVQYPWHGSRTKQAEQVGNAVAPPLAARVQASLGLGCL